VPPTPSELRAAGRDWLGNLAKRYPLQRRLYLVPGICNEDAQMWDTIWHWGMLSIPNWADYAERIRFETLTARDDFRDFGDHVRGLIAARYPYDPTHQVGEFDVVCYSMGGLDTCAAMVDLRATPVVPARGMAKAFHFITLDTPFGGVPNWALRRSFPDMSGRPDRQTQCDALNPDSPQLAALRAARGALAGVAERIVCYSAGGDSAVQVPLESSNLCYDAQPASLWGAAPTYASHLIPGASHAGESAIFDNEYLIASVFGQLLFGR
jgi:hypothetical protein